MAKVISIRLDDALARQLDELSAAVDQPRSWLIVQAIRQYVEEQAWQVQAIQDALSEYRTGTAPIMPHEQVMKRMAARIK
jgi:predicted transcriptional regulator